MGRTSILVQPASIEFVLCDLDGVVWLSHEAIPGAAGAVDRLRASGRRVLFVTNNSVATLADQEAALAHIGIPATGDVVTSAQAAATLVRPDEAVLVCGGPGVVEAVTAAGANVVRPDEAPADGPDAVVVGLDRSFGFETLNTTSRAIREGARFVATNDDPTFPTPGGATPGAGSIVAAVATAAGHAPVIAGKPHRPMAELVAATCGPTFAAGNALMVGDRWSTDGAFAETIGCPFALVRSGVTAHGGAPGGAVDVDVDDLPGVADLLVEGGAADSRRR